MDIPTMVIIRTAMYSVRHTALRKQTPKYNTYDIYFLYILSVHYKPYLFYIYHIFLMPLSCIAAN